MALRRGTAIRRALRSATRIRSKLFLLHTAFSCVLAIVLLIVLRYPIKQLVSQAERRECVLAVNLYLESPQKAVDADVEGLVFIEGTEAEERVGLTRFTLGALESGDVTTGETNDGSPFAAAWDAQRETPVVAVGASPLAKAAVHRLYVALTLSILGVYGVIAVFLELFVLPSHVYLPIDRLRRADEAIRDGKREQELIPEHDIPSDELGDIMRSRNRSILELRDQEHRLAGLLNRVEQSAAELKKKNYLLETARRNLADQDRLASLGMMSVGIAHELNTPLAVLKGSTEQLAEGVDPCDEQPRDRIALMRRVIGRLERLSDSLLDFARARPHSTDTVEMRAVVQEAWTLVSLDREASGIDLRNKIDPSIVATGDADRFTQVFVNLLRNAVDAIGGVGGTSGGGWIVVRAEHEQRDGGFWVSVTVTDSGPGIDPGTLARVFEPFATTRLDARGSGLGLAVSEGIVREHGGMLFARNSSAPDEGAVFELVVPIGECASVGKEGSRLIATGDVRAT